MNSLELLVLREWIIKKDRFILPPDLEKITNKILEQSRARITLLKKGDVYWRARRIPDSVFSPAINGQFPADEMGAPPPEITLESRVTPKGISCLYLSVDKKTAAVETRPSLSTRVQVAPFVLQRDLNVLDLTMWSLNLFNRSNSDLPQHQQKQLFLGHLFTLPVDNENAIEYVFSQYLANLFKVKLGVDGLKFESRQRLNGYNLALFDVESAKIENPSAMEVKKVGAIMWDFYPTEGPISVDLNKYKPFFDW